MTRRGRGGLAALLAVLVAGWVVLAVGTAGRPDRQEFDDALAKSAQAALSAVRTTQLAGRAGLNGRATRTYLSPVLDDGLRTVVTAQQRVAQVPPPDPAQAGARNELVKLLDLAVHTTGDLVGAFQRDDRAGFRTAVGALGPIGDRLAAFLERLSVERHRQ